jgi:predicted transcriptional regulator
VERKYVNVREKYDEIVRIKSQIQSIKKERSNASQNLKMILNKIIDQQKAALETMVDE